MTEFDNQIFFYIDISQLKGEKNSNELQINGQYSYKIKFNDLELEEYYSDNEKEAIMKFKLSYDEKVIKPFKAKF